MSATTIEETSAERRRRESNTAVTISREELANLVWLAQNDMRQVEQRYPYQSGAAGSERAIRKTLLERSAATLRDLRTAVQQ